ncbi:unnamed protein product [Cuscuta epithymum]|uniref:Uncharacterized protein n=1 Tax=Cuscuta epithymum TaxID=186058 RepID=A0AAV0GBV6_9ASTE|nr:unnamed protein product [Cuscuta epithymum]
MVDQINPTTATVPAAPATAAHPISSAPATLNGAQASFGSSMDQLSLPQVTMPIGPFSTAAQISSPPSASLSQRFRGVQPQNNYRLFGMPEPFTWASSAPTMTSLTLPPPPVFHDVGSSSRMSEFSGPTFTGQPGVASFQQTPGPLLPGFNNSQTPLSSLASQLAFSTPNVNNIVTTRLSEVEDYLPWRTQFESFFSLSQFIGNFGWVYSATITHHH